jgi:hypothetical protein
MSAAPKQRRRRSKRARNPNRRSIKIHRNYTVEEAAHVTGSTKGTIRRWIKSGALPAITDLKPNLILGGDLFDYLKARATSGRSSGLTSAIASNAAHRESRLWAWPTMCP